MSKDEQISILKFEKSDLRLENTQLKFEIAQLKKLIFGAKSERFTSEEVSTAQLNLFESPEEEDEIKDTVEQISYERKKGKKHKGRNELPEHLPVKEVIIEPDVDTTNMIKIGEQVTETLDYTPASLIKIITIRPKYVVKEEDIPGANNIPIIIAPAPSRPIEKCIAESGLLAHIIVCKFIDHLPFYRQIQRFERDFKWEPSKSTINDWFINVCTLLDPLYQLLQKEILESNYLLVDESTIKVQDKSKKGRTHLGYQWVYMDIEKNLVLFHYHKSRSVQAPKELLGTYKGYIQCDGYAVYNKLATLNTDIKLIGCWVHARRKFYDAKDSDVKRSDFALNIFRKVYQHETICKEYTNEQRKAYRQEHLHPLFQELKTWIQEQGIKVLPKSPIGKAMSYTLSQWPKLIRCLEDGRLQLDNNLIENKIRPLALGRKNYLFAGSHPAAQRIAMMYTFFASCKANNVNPQEWLTKTLQVINDTKISELHSLLPNFYMT